MQIRIEHCTVAGVDAQLGGKVELLGTTDALHSVEIRSGRTADCVVGSVGLSYDGRPGSKHCAQIARSSHPTAVSE